MKFRLIQRSLVFLFSLALFALGANAAKAADFYIVLDKGAVVIGDSLRADIKIDSNAVNINAAQATLNFSNDVLEIADLSKANSVFGFWLEEPVFSNANGTVTFIGGSASNVAGKSLQVLRVNFKVKNAGVAKLSFTDGAITAGDGSGTNVLSAMRDIEIQSFAKTITAPPPITTAPLAPPAEVQPEAPPPPPPPIISLEPVQIIRKPVPAAKAPVAPEVSVPLYPEQTKWYNISSRFFATWELPPDVSDVAAVINKIPKFNPIKSEGLFDNKPFEALDDGIWYLHIRFRNNVGWGATTNYKISVDTAPPLAFDIKVPEGAKTDIPSPTIIYATTDDLSGLDFYLVRVDNNEPVNTNENIFKLPILSPGKHALSVSAVDKAQNVTEKLVILEILPLESPIISSIGKDVFAGEGGLEILGTSRLGFTINLLLKQRDGQFLFSTKATPDSKGNWNAKIDYPLKKGAYFVEIVAEDARGATSLPVESATITVRDRPLLRFAGIEITQFWFFLGLIVILLLVFGGGWLTHLLWHRKLGPRTIIAERDIINAFNLVRKDIDKCLAKYADKVIDEREAYEIEYLLKQITANLDKTQKYIIENVEEISK